MPRLRRFRGISACWATSRNAFCRGNGLQGAARHPRLNRVYPGDDLYANQPMCEAVLASGGWARWKIENETFNVLKNRGYNLEHNFGHARMNLSATLAALNLVAFAIHTAAELADAAWGIALKIAGARIRFFNHLRSLTVFILLPAWKTLLETISFQTPPPSRHHKMSK